MKFSLKFIRKLAPGVKNKKDTIERLNSYSFESADLGGDILDISIPPNRFSDAASHLGIAREISAIYGKNFSYPIRFSNQNLNRGRPPVKIKIQEKNSCPRYAAQYFENIKIGESPSWVKKILIDCGLRPINNVVDILNYVMLETGQPLHAFDFDKIEGKTLVIRPAKKGEKITVLDGTTYDLNENILLIADALESLAIAGIKGGKKAEIGKNTKRIVVEAANFNGVLIYKASKFLKLRTDASLRFSHNITPDLVPFGLGRAEEMLLKVCGAKAGPISEVNFSKSRKKIVKFEFKRFKDFIGLNLDFTTVSKQLALLGFKVILDTSYKLQDTFYVEPPILRQDIEIFEDVSEEVSRLYGYNRISSIQPRVQLAAASLEDSLILKDKVRMLLRGLGLSEIYNYSFAPLERGYLTRFAGKNFKSVELENPLNQETQFLKSSLASGLVKNIKFNSKFFDKISVFEIGKIFYRVGGRIEEKNILGLALFEEGKERFFELKGLMAQILKGLGIVDYLLAEGIVQSNISNSRREFAIKSSKDILKIESGGESLGYAGRMKLHDHKNWVASVAEIDLDQLLKLAIEEHEYRPLPKYPSIMRDITLALSPEIRVGDVVSFIQSADKFIDDVDLIDEYGQNLTFRIIFQAEDRTLTDAEVNQKMEGLVKSLERKFKTKVK